MSPLPITKPPARGNAGGKAKAMKLDTRITAAGYVYLGETLLSRERISKRTANHGDFKRADQRKIRAWLTRENREGRE